MTLERLRAGVRAGGRRVADDLADVGAPTRSTARWSWSRKEGHCLNDLLYRQSIGALPIEIPAVVSNHTDLERLVEVLRHPVPPHPGDGRHARPTAEAELLALVDSLGIHLVVLARYMQILSDETCARAAGPGDQHPPLVPAELQGRAALPAGLRPRREAGRRDRALRQPRPRRGADHRAGRRARRPLAERRRSSWRPGATSRARCCSRAVRWHAETRVLLNGHRTVVFR